MVYKFFSFPPGAFHTDQSTASYDGSEKEAEVAGVPHDLHMGEVAAFDDGDGTSVTQEAM